jgi:RNA polymerase-binding protein DksA
MDDSFVSKMEETLLDMKRDILATIEANSSSFRSITENKEAKDEVDAASDDIDRKMIETLGLKDAARVKQIDAAISRIRAGKYGICVKCGKKISQARLEAIPYAAHCIECQSKTEARR